VRQLRYAQQVGKQLGCSGCLGQLDPPEAAAGGLPIPPELLPPSFSIPIVTEEEAAKREAAAYDRGRQEEQGSVIKTAAISAAVSAVVGIVIGKFLG